MFGKKKKEDMVLKAEEKKEHIKKAWEEYLNVASYSFKPGQIIYIKALHVYGDTIFKGKFKQIKMLTFDEFSELESIPTIEFFMKKYIWLYIDLEDGLTRSYNAGDYSFHNSFNSCIPEEFRTLDAIENNDWKHYYLNPSIFKHEEFPFTIEEVNRALTRGMYKQMKTLLIGQQISFPFNSAMRFCRVLNGFILLNGNSPVMIIPESEIEKEIKKITVI